MTQGARKERPWIGMGCSTEQVPSTHLCSIPVAPPVYARIFSHYLHASLFTRTSRSPLLLPPHRLSGSCRVLVGKKRLFLMLPRHLSLLRLP